MALVFLGLHIVTAVVDPYTHLGITAATVPFGSSYRTVLARPGHGRLRADARRRRHQPARGLIGQRAWRAVHLLAFACWPLAIAHGLGTGTDGGSTWMRAVTALCVVAVAGALAQRLHSQGDPLGRDRRVAMRRASAEAGR